MVVRVDAGAHGRVRRQVAEVVEDNLNFDVDQVSNPSDSEDHL